MLHDLTMKCSWPYDLRLFMSIFSLIFYSRSTIIFKVKKSDKRAKIERFRI